MRKFLSLLLVMLPLFSLAQFAPAQDQPGTTAMHADSSAFIGWATDCVVVPGPMNIANPDAGVAGAGYPASNGVGIPDGTYGVACLGDGGYATLTFASPIANGPGPDFAVFENGFKSGTQWFLEIAFVEVSSDGEHFFRFPAITNVQYETQLGGFATMDPSQIHNFAGKYGAFYGTPFDLDEVEDNPLLNKYNVTHVRVIDVVGCIQEEYATHDSQGHPVNDPWPTPFASSGFDLDAVGVIHDQTNTPIPVPTDATIAPEDILYWIGEGEKEVVFAVNWAEPDTALAWGYRYSGESLVVKDVMDAIAETDLRFSYETGQYGVGDILFNDGNLNLALVGAYWMYNINGVGAGLGYDQQPVNNGDFIKWGDIACATEIAEWTYVWEKEVAPVTVYNASVSESTTVLSLYPNPATSFTMLEVGELGNATVIISDVQGRVLNSFVVSQANEPFRIETAGYQAGLYFVTVSNATRRQTLKLFVQ